MADFLATNPREYVCATAAGTVYNSSLDRCTCKPGYQSIGNYTSNEVSVDNCTLEEPIATTTETANITETTALFENTTTSEATNITTASLDNITTTETANITTVLFNTTLFSSDSPLTTTTLNETSTTMFPLATTASSQGIYIYIF